MAMRARGELSFLLLQARRAGDRVIDEEQDAFCRQLGVDRSQVVGHDIFEDPFDLGRSKESDAVLVGGSGEFGVFDGHPRIDAMVQHLVDLAEDGHPIFASCFGFQALVVGLGGSVVTDEEGAEVGTYSLTTTDEARTDPLFCDLPSVFNAQLGHKDRAERLPGGVTNLAASVLCPYQALRIDGAPVYATQFHPELTWADNRTRFERYMAQYGRLFGEAEAQRKLDSHQPSPEANGLLGRFVDKIILGEGE